jgi:DNA polymerase-3 subunit alpha
MQISSLLANYTLGEADLLRRAMGKKIAEEMAKQKGRFMAGSRENNLPDKKAEKIFDLMANFAEYGFNKSHSAAYALIAFQTAYLKANYPVEFMTALLNTYSGNTDKMKSAISECRRLSIAVLPPDINRSATEFSIEKFQGKLAIRFSLTAIKNVGSAAIESIIAVRDNEGQFKSIEDFSRKVDLRNINRKVMESLIKAGAFDSIALRGSLLEAMTQIISLSQRERQLKESGQSSMFDLWGDSVATPLPSLELENFDVPVKEKLMWEKELMGVYFSEHPLNSISSKFTPSVTTFCGQIVQEMIGENVIVAGMLVSVRHLTTKDGRPFVIATLEDIDGTIDITVWTETFIRTKDLWAANEVILVEGKVKLRDDRLIINCTGARKYDPEPDNSHRTEAAPSMEKHYKLSISLDDRFTDEQNINRLNKILDILNTHSGEDPVNLAILTNEGETYMELPSVKYSEKLQTELGSILDSQSLIIEEIT